MASKPTYLLDSFALLAYLNDEAGGGRVQEVLAQGVSSLMRNAERLRDPAYLDGRGCAEKAIASQTRSGNHGSSRLNR